MNTEPNNSQESVPVEVISDDSALVKEETAKASETAETANQILQETVALIEAIRTKAQSETQKAGEIVRESYLEGVRNARQEVEKLNLFERNRIDDAMNQIETEVEKDWDNLVKRFTGLGERINEAAKAAWEVLTTPKSEDDSQK